MHEVRFTQTELRAKGGNTISGYAAVFNQWSDDLGGFREVLRPGCFTRALRTSDIRCLFNHDSNEILGRNRAGTLKVSEDSTGLWFECKLPDTQRARDTYVSIERGDINQCSFGFYVSRNGQRWNKDGTEREIIEARELVDVSPVTYPAYPQTSVGARSLWPEGIPAEVRQHRTSDKVTGCYSLRSAPKSAPVIARPRPDFGGDAALEAAWYRNRLKLVELDD